MADTTGEQDLRKEYIDGAVKAVALMEYKLKTLCTVDTSSAWTETYYRETNTELTGGGVASPTTVKGIPRLAPFPYGEASWTKVSAVIEKYGMEGMISYEDAQLNNIPMIQRTILKIGRAVSFAIDSQIAAVMLASAGNTFGITAGSEWDSATVANRDPVYDILTAIQMLRADNIDALNGNGYLCLNGTDYTNLISNSKVVNNPSFKTADVVSNGVVGQICGLKIMVTQALEATTPDVAYVVVAKEAMTWKEATPLTVLQIEDPGIKTTIRAFELGVCQMTSPNAVCKITNTRK
jgi:hypothetical protein